VKTTDYPQQQRQPLSPKERIGVLIEEYRALYKLATFRMMTLDRRVLLAWAALAAFLASFFAVAPVGQQALLIALPFAIIWLNRTTIGHARSFEDVIRRIDEIERIVNRIAGEELLAFQSRHPSKSVAVGGRTGTETVRTVFATALSMLGVAAYLQGLVLESGPALFIAYAVLCATAALHITIAVVMFRRYRYDKQRLTETTPIVRPS